MTTNAAPGGARRGRRRPPAPSRVRKDLSALFTSVGEDLLKASRAHDGPVPERAIPHLHRAARRLLSYPHP